MITGFSVLGFDVYDDCGIKSRATDGVSELVPLTEPSEVMQCKLSDCDGTDPRFLGLSTFRGLLYILSE